MAIQIWKLLDDFISGLPGSEISQYEADRNTRTFESRLSLKDLWVAHDMLFPVHWHGVILAR